jgi:hypothetical protein
MMAEAKIAGLAFKDTPGAEPDALLSTDFAKHRDGTSTIHAAGSAAIIATVRAGSPISMKRCRGARMQGEAFTPVPKIHESVFGRIRVGAHLYTPIGVPADYEIVTARDVTPSTAPPPHFEAVVPRIEPNEEHPDRGTIWPKAPRRRRGTRRNRTSGTSSGASA